MTSDQAAIRKAVVEIMAFTSGPLADEEKVEEIRKLLERAVEVTKETEIRAA